LVDARRTVSTRRGSFMSSKVQIPRSARDDKSAFPVSSSQNLTGRTVHETVTNVISNFPPRRYVESPQGTNRANAFADVRV
jgi:hypothetical protein